MEIIVETSYYQTVYPAEKHEVGSFVGENSVKIMGYHFQFRLKQRQLL